MENNLVEMCFHLMIGLEFVLENTDIGDVRWVGLSHFNLFRLKQLQGKTHHSNGGGSTPVVGKMRRWEAFVLFCPVMGGLQRFAFICSRLGAGEALRLRSHSLLSPSHCLEQTAPILSLILFPAVSQTKRHISTETDIYTYI